MTDSSQLASSTMTTGGTARRLPVTPLNGAAGNAQAISTQSSAAAREQLAAARRFEALLVHDMLKAMRSTTFAEDGGQDQSMYYDMLDEKLAKVVTEQGGLGLAEHIARQMGSSGTARPTGEQSQPVSDLGTALTTDNTVNPATSRKPAGLDQNDLQRLRALLPERSSETPATPTGTDGATATIVDRLRPGRSLWTQIDRAGPASTTGPKQSFVDELLPMARRSAERLGTTAASVLAVAAHESDWGRQVIGNDDGDSSHNLFGIKAFGDRPGMWHQTTEYVNGERQSVQARFRAYVDKGSSINDFADFLQSNPRYATALQHADEPERFIKELHGAGYATDPNYASKVISVMRQIESLAPTTQGRPNT